MVFVEFASVSLCLRSLCPLWKAFWSFQPFFISMPSSLQTGEQLWRTAHSTPNHIQECASIHWDSYRWLTDTNKLCLHHTQIHRHTLTTLTQINAWTQPSQKQIYNSSWLCTVEWTMTSIKTHKMWPK